MLGETLTPPGRRRDRSSGSAAHTPSSSRSPVSIVFPGISEDKGRYGSPRPDSGAPVRRGTVGGAYHRVPLPGGKCRLQDLRSEVPFSSGNVTPSRMLPAIGLNEDQQWLITSVWP